MRLDGNGVVDISLPKLGFKDCCAKGRLLEMLHIEIGNDWTKWILCLCSYKKPNPLKVGGDENVLETCCQVLLGSCYTSETGPMVSMGTKSKLNKNKNFSHVILRG